MPQKDVTIVIPFTDEMFDMLDDESFVKKITDKVVSDLLLIRDARRVERERLAREQGK